MDTYMFYSLAQERLEPTKTVVSFKDPLGLLGLLELVAQTGQLEHLAQMALLVLQVHAERLVGQHTGCLVTHLTMHKMICTISFAKRARCMSSMCTETY